MYSLRDCFSGCLLFRELDDMPDMVAVGWVVVMRDDRCWASSMRLTLSFVLQPGYSTLEQRAVSKCGGARLDDVAGCLWLKKCT